MEHENRTAVGRTDRIRVRLLAPLAAVLAVAGLSVPASAQSLPSAGIETIEEAHVLLDAVPIRPLIVSPAGDRVWAVNVQLNCVQEFVAAGAPARTFEVPWNPISIAFYQSTDGTYPGDKLLVVCRGTYALVSVDLTTGKVDRMLRLPAQPADLIVDAAPGNQRAFVSCQADDKVVEIDLKSRMSIARTFKIPGKTPTSLFFDSNGDVMVAPLHSGNNSGIHKSADFRDLQAKSLGILDFDDPNIATTGLPDEDLFRCVRATGAVAAVAHSLGTLLYSAGYNATTNSWWVLNAEALNKNPSKQTEASIRGEFALNRLSIVDCASGAIKRVVLDDMSPVPTQSIGHPDGMAITSVGWVFLVGTTTDNVALLDPAGNVQLEWDLPDGSIPRQVVWSPVLNSVFVHCWGSNTVEAYSLGVPPMHWGTFRLGLDPTSDARKAGRRLFYDGANSLHGSLSCETCHAYGENDFLAWNLSHGVEEEKGPLVTQTLRGIDGTMPFHWRGEQQKGIADFNPAFANLLGGQQLTTNQLSQLTAYLLALRSDANPHQAADRLPSSSIQPPLAFGHPAGNAVVGEQVFSGDCMRCHGMPTGSNNEVQVLQGLQLNQRRQRFEVGTFNGAWKKHQDSNPLSPGVDLVTVVFNTTANPTLPATEQYPLLGYGFGHAGTLDSLEEFVGIFGLDGLPPPGPVPVPVPGPVTSNVVAFIDQFDQRMAPMSHEGHLLNQAAVIVPGSTIAADLQGLLNRAIAGQGDVAVFGTSVVGGVSRQLRWRYEPTTDSFLPDQSGLPPPAPTPPPPHAPTDYTLGFFLAQASSGTGSVTFVGLPRGTSRGFAIDRDMDDALDLDEVAASTSPYARDTDADGWWDGHEMLNAGNPLVSSIGSNDQQAPSVAVRVLSVTTRNAVLAVEADEPVTVDVTYQATGIGPRLASSTTPARLHRIVLDDLEASTGVGATFQPLPSGWLAVSNTYSLVVQAKDLANLPAPAPTIAPPPSFYSMFGSGISTSSFQMYQPISVVLANLTKTSGSLTGTTFNATVRYRVDYAAGVYGTGANDYVPVFRVFRNGALVPATDLVAATPPMFDVRTGPGTSIPYLIPGLTVPGPFLVGTTPTGAPWPGTGLAGTADLTFGVLNVNPGDALTLNVEFVGSVVGWNPAAPVLESIQEWDMPSTAAVYRKIVLQ